MTTAKQDFKVYRCDLNNMSWSHYPIVAYGREQALSQVNALNVAASTFEFKGVKNYPSKPTHLYILAK